MNVKSNTRALRSAALGLSLGAIVTSAFVACGGKVAADICHDDTECPSGYSCQGGDCIGPPPVVCAGGQSACGPTCLDHPGALWVADV
jgi:hypothetical protein